MLNRCFDDIERFVARIQQAAMIQRESERRRGNRPITLPPQFPAEMEFHEILQKFKYCFNLLVRFSFFFLGYRTIIISFFRRN